MTSDRRGRAIALLAAAVAAAAGAALLLSSAGVELGLLSSVKRELPAVDELPFAGGGVGSRRSLLDGVGRMDAVGVRRSMRRLDGHVDTVGGKVCTTEGHRTRYCGAPRDERYTTMLPCCRSLVCDTETFKCVQEVQEPPSN